MSDHLKRVFIDARWLWIAVALLILGVSFKGMGYLTVNSDFEVFFEEDNPNLMTYHQQQDVYSSNDNILFVVTPSNEKVFSATSMEAVIDLTDRAWQLPWSNRVDSLANFQSTRGDGDDLIVEDLVAEPQTMNEAEFELAKSIALAEPALYKRLIRDEARVTAVNVMFTLPKEDKSPALVEIVAEARALSAAMMSEYPGLDIKLTGKLMNNNAFKESTRGDLKSLVPLASLIALIAVGFFIRLISGSFRSMVLASGATLVIVMFAIISAFGVAGFVGIEVTPPLANAPTIILTLAIADAMHVMVNFFQSLDAGKEKKEALVDSLRLNFWPIFLTSITTLVGFLSLNFSDSPPFQDLGNIVAIGVFFAWLYSITLLPAVMSFLPFKSVRSQEQQAQAKQGFMLSLADWVIQYRSRILPIAGFSIVGILLFIPQNELNDVWAEYFDETTVHRQASEYMRANLTTSNTVEFSLGASDVGQVTNPEYLNNLQRFSEWLENHPQVYQVTSFVDVIKRLNKNMHADDEAYYRIPDDPQLAAQYLLLYEMSLPFGLDLTNMINMDKSATRVFVVIADSNTSALLDFLDDAALWQKENLPEYMFDKGISSDVMFAHMSYSNIRGMLEGTLLALLIISVMMAVALKSAYYGALSFFANVIPAAIGFGLWGIFVGEIGLSTSVVAGMTLGIVVDYNVHLLSKYLRAKKENQLSTEEALRFAFNTVGVALLVTTAVLVINFSILSMSTFKLNADMGLLTAITIVIALVIDFLVLPAVLLLRAKSHKRASQDKPEKQQEEILADAAGTV